MMLTLQGEVSEDSKPLLPVGETADSCEPSEASCTEAGRGSDRWVWLLSATSGRLSPEFLLLQL